MSTTVPATSIVDDDSRKRSRSATSDSQSSSSPSAQRIDEISTKSKKKRLTVETTRDQAIDAVAEIHLIVAQQRLEIDQLRSVVNSQQVHIDFLLSMLGVTPPPETAPCASTSDNTGQYSLLSSTVCPPVVDSVAASAPTFAAMTAKSLPVVQPLAKKFTSAIVSAVYRDMDDRDRRARNIVVNGLPACDDDKVSVTRLLTSEFNNPPNVIKVRRLGRESPGKLRPLLVILADTDQALSYIRRARQLRQSSDGYVKSSVYINADATRAEALAAYQIRCERRDRSTRAAAARSQQQSKAGSSSSSAATLHPTAREFRPVAGQHLPDAAAAVAAALSTSSSSSTTQHSE